MSEHQEEDNEEKGPEQVPQGDPPKEEQKSPKPEVAQEVREIALSQIVKEAKEQELPPPIVNVPVPVVQNPVYHYKGHEKYNWRVQELKATVCVQKLETKILPEVYEQSIPNDVEFKVIGTANVKKHIHYNLLIKDKKGEREVSRRFTEYMIWRNKLTHLWPCLFLASLPTKTLIGVSEDYLIHTRSKYIIRFLRSLSRHETLYYSQQVQIFLKASQVNLQTYLDSLITPKYLDIFEKYKGVYSEEHTYSQREQFMYRKEQMPVILDEYETYFSSKKIDLMDYQGAIRRLADSKQTYFKAINKLHQTLLPDYEDIIYRWTQGEPMPQHAPSIIERLSFKRKASEAESKQSPSVVEQMISKRKASEVINKSFQEGEAKQEEKVGGLAKYGLCASEAYKSRWEDAATLTNGHNKSTWGIYDVIKFQLKEIDTVIGAIEQVKGVQREMDYLKRTIVINKEQVEALNSNKTTLKTFFMDGKKDDKLSKLTNDNQSYEEQMEKLTELYYLLIVLLEKQLTEYHKEKAVFYKQSMLKAFSDELGLARSVMDFHIYEEQLFAKERLQRLHALKGEAPLQEHEEEIRERS